MLVSILLYVDGLVIVGADLEEIGYIKSERAKSFKMKDLRGLHYFRRIKII